MTEAGGPVAEVHDPDGLRGEHGVERGCELAVARTPVRAPQANAIAERWIGSLRRELLDRVLIVNRRQLEHVLAIFVDHYNTHRPHRSLNQAPPARTTALHLPDEGAVVDRRQRLGGLINEYTYPEVA